MSLIIFKPEGVTLNSLIINKENFISKKSLAVNYSYAKNGELKTIKSGIYDSKIWDNIEKLTEFPVLLYVNEKDKEILLKEECNWSPVSIDKNVVIAGVGPILNVKGDRGKRQSDVRVFVDKALREATVRVPDFLFSNSGVWMIDAILSSRAAMVALRNDGSYSIFNEGSGREFNGLWIFDELIANVKYAKMQFIYAEHGWREMYD